MNRSKKLALQVQMLLADPSGRYAADVFVYDKLSGEQDYLCFAHNALKVIQALTLKLGQGRYEADSPLWKIVSITPPATWSGNLEIVTSTGKWEEYKRGRISASHPVKFHVWAGVLEMIPAPTRDGEQLEIAAYSRPESRIEETIEPLLDTVWDDALMYGAALALYSIPAIKKNAVGFDPKEIQELYGGAVDAAKAAVLNEVAGQPHTVSHNSDGLGF